MIKILTTLMLYLLAMLPVGATQCSFGVIYLRSNSDILAFNQEFENCDTLNGHLFIGYDASLELVGDFKRIRTLIILLYYGSVLKGLDSLISVDTISISGINIRSIEGFSNLKFVNDAFQIARNSSLEEISGFGKLETIGDNRHKMSFAIYDNPLLKSISFLRKTTIYNASINDQFDLHDNPNLEVCNYPSICNYIQMPKGNCDIARNKEGCNSIEQVREACLVSDVAEEAAALRISIYPNPISGDGTATISHTKPITSIQISNAEGKPILLIRNADNFDLSAYQPGLYFIKITDITGSTFVKKVVKI